MKPEAFFAESYTKPAKGKAGGVCVAIDLPTETISDLISNVQ